MSKKGEFMRQLRWFVLKMFILTQVGEGEGGDQEEAGEAGRQAGLQLPQLS